MTQKQVFSRGWLTQILHSMAYKPSKGHKNMADMQMASNILLKRGMFSVLWRMIDYHFKEDEK